MEKYFLYPIKSIGQYFMFLGSMFKHRVGFKTYFQRIMTECIDVGIHSLTIVSIVSIFIGAVSCIQISYNLVSPFVPRYIIGYGVRNMIILELSPTIISIILAGKVGSNIAGQLASMRITEQISALEVMGINPSTYLVLPKILACVLMYPLLVILSGTLALYSGYLAARFILNMDVSQYVYGIQFMFDPYAVQFAIYKTFAFSFLISSIAAYKGFFVFGAGGAVAIGKASTEAVTNSCSAVLAADYILTQLLL